MKMPLRQLPSRSTQHGAVAVMAAIMMATLLMFLAIVVDTGRLFLERRSLQKNADLAALETALLYCRDQTMDDDGRRAVAVDALSASRNDFRGSDGDIAVALGRVTAVSDGAGGAKRQFTADATGKAVQVTLTRTISASLFQQLWPNSPGTINLSRSSVAQACEPTAQLTLRSNLLTVDSSQSALLNGLLGGLLGTSLNLGVADWQSLVDTNINLLSYFDALATELNLDVGDYDNVLASEVSVGDLLDVAADVMQAGGETAAVAALDLISQAIPAGTPLVALGDILQVQTGTEEAGLDTNLQLMQLVQGTIQLANTESAIDATIPVNLGIVSATLRVKVTEPPQYSAVGNPESAKNDPYGGDAIYVRSSQIKVLASLNLPIGNTLNSLINNSLISSVTTLVHDLLSLNLVGLLNTISCTIYCEKEVIDIDILPSPHVDVLLTAGEGVGRVSDYSCNTTTGEKSLTANSRSSIATVAVGLMNPENALSSQELSTSPIPIVDIGSQKYGCSLLVACYPIGPRIAFYGGGIGIEVSPGDNPASPISQSLLFENFPSESYLPEIDQDLTEDAFHQIDSQGVVSDISSILSDIDLIFYEPENGGIGGGLGSVVYLLGSVVEPLVDGVTDLLDAALAPLVDNILNNVLDLLGASLAEVEVGAAMTCENDKVRLVM